MIVSASLTDRCNLACDYCYGGSESCEDMSLETLSKIVDFAVSSTPEGDTLEFGFFGGEPLLRPDLMRSGAEMVETSCDAAGVEFQLRVTTNGTLLDDDAVSFLSRYGVNVCVSIDGPPSIHDLHRRYPDGTGSSADVVENLRRAASRLDTLQVNAVFGPDTVALLDRTVAFLAAQGIRLIHLNPDISASWPHESHDEMFSAYEKVADIVVAHYRAGMPLIVNLIDSKIVLFLKDGYSPSDRCGMGTTKIGFAPDGSMYPCERLIDDGRNGHCFGSVHTGGDPIRLAMIQAHTGNRNPECRSCAVERFCMNWCGCTNYHMTGATDLVAPALCASEKASMAAARSALADLADVDLFIEHLMARLGEDCGPQKGLRS